MLQEIRLLGGGGGAGVSTSIWFRSIKYIFNTLAMCFICIFVIAQG